MSPLALTLQRDIHLCLKKRVMWRLVLTHCSDRCFSLSQGDISLSVSFATFSKIPSPLANTSAGPGDLPAGTAQTLIADWSQPRFSSLCQAIIATISCSL